MTNERNQAVFQIRFRKHLPFVLFLGLFFVVGISIYRDYGFPWDDIYQLDLIHRTYNYINQWDTSLLSYEFKYLGPTSELILLTFCRLFPSLNEAYARHIGIFLFFLAGLFPVYWIGLRLYKNELWALLGVICLSLSPRFFGDAFYNSKDIPFMVTCTFAIFSLYQFMDSAAYPLKKRVSMIFIHSFFTAFCMSTRIAGIIFLILSVMMIFWEFRHGSKIGK